MNEASMEQAFSVESDAYTMHWSLSLTKWQGTFVLLVWGWRISIVIGRTSSHRGSLNRGSTEGIDSFELAFFREHQLIVKKKKQLCFETFQLYLNKNITTNIMFLFSCHDLVDADLNYLREGRDPRKKTWHWININHDECIFCKVSFLMWHNRC